MSAIILPSKLSDLALLGLEALAQVEAQPDVGRLLALDSLRAGSLAEAAFRAGLGGAEQLRALPLSRAMPDYLQGSFRSEMERLVVDLKREGL